MEYSWTSPQLAALAGMRERLPHALLLHGREGVGQLELALTFAAFILCERPDSGGRACGTCAACSWFSQGNHPDFRLLQPDALSPDDEESETPSEGKKKSDQIRIEQVRDLQRFLAVGTHRAGHRVIVLHPADSMNNSTQNAVLKSLEEPPPQTLFMLVTSHPHRLLPTIRSRCQGVAVPVPDRQAAATWLREQGAANPEELLALAGGAPLAAVRLAEHEPLRRRLIEQLSDPRFDPVVATEACLTAEPAEVVGWLQRWVYDILAIKSAGDLRYHIADRETLSKLSVNCSASACCTLLRALARARALAQHPLNTRLFFEDLLIQYRSVFGPAAPTAR